VKELEEHECEFLSVCCDVSPIMGIEETGLCGRCHEHTGFKCFACEDSDVLAYALNMIEGEVKG